MVRVYFIGSGLSEPELLVKEAWDILSSSGVALVINGAWGGGEWPWNVIREDVSASEVGNRLHYWLHRESSVAVMVPQAPAFNALMGEWVWGLRAEHINCAIVPGVWHLTAALDYAGYCVGGALTLHSGPSPVIELRAGFEHPEHGPRRCREERWGLQGEEGGSVTVTARAVTPHFWKTMSALSAKRVLVVGSGAGANRARRFLREYGAEAMIGTVSALADPERWDEVDGVLNHVEGFDWVVFSSQEGVSRFWRSLQRLQVDIRRLRAQVAAVGPQTAQSLRDHGVYPQLTPDGDYSQEGLVAAFSLHPLLGKSVLLVQGDLNRSVLQDAMAQRGAALASVQFYRNLKVDLAPAVVDMLRRQAIDAIFYTASSSAIRLFGSDPEVQAVLQNTLAVSIGAQTSRTLRRLGARSVVEPPAPSAEGMVEELVRYYTAQRQE